MADHDEIKYGARRACCNDDDGFVDPQHRRGTAHLLTTPSSSSTNRHTSGGRRGLLAAADDVLAAAIDAAHVEGARVTAHVFGTDALPGESVRGSTASSTAPGSATT